MCIPKSQISSVEHLANFVQFTNYDVECERAQDSNGNPINRCLPCIRRGLPCSWSYVSVLTGEPWHKQYDALHHTYVDNNPARGGVQNTHRALKSLVGKNIYTPRFEEIESNLCSLVPNLEAQKTREIRYPGITPITEQTFTMEDELMDELELRDD